MPKRKLPDDAELLKLRDFQGLGYTEIAELYGATKSAVSYRFVKMNRSTGTHNAMDYREIIPWEIQRKHLPLDAANRLRAHVRYQMGLDVTDAARRRLENWWSRLRSENVVLTYTATDVGAPWQYVERQPKDDGLIIRWPEDMSPPTDEQRRALSLPAQ